MAPTLCGFDLHDFAALSFALCSFDFQRFAAFAFDHSAASVVLRVAYLSLAGDVADQLNGTLMEKVAGKKAANQGTAEYKKIGHMLPETKRILDDFYQPFITRLAEILNDKRFLWLDKGR